MVVVDVFYSGECEGEGGRRRAVGEMSPVVGR